MSRPDPRSTMPAGPRRRSLAVPALALGLALATVWAVGASYYLLVPDAVTARFLAQQDAVRAAYEARLAEMGSRLERLSGDKGEESDDAEARLAALAERLSALEGRQSALSVLAGAPATGPSEPDVTGSLPTRRSGREPFSLRGGHSVPGRRSEAMGLKLAALEGAADALGAAQADSLERLAARSREGLDRVRGVLVRTGLDLARFERPRAGIGGPLVPVSLDAFGQALAQAERERADELRLRKLAADLPLRRPVLGDLILSSGFGTRLDPFTRGLALHTGLDLKAEMGSPAYATAAGRVVSAEPAGGYGNLVEIDHGHGISTRYAHLASFSVRPGEFVSAGRVVGLVGSTGRSTGSHLHYETRIDGEPVNPIGFLEAGADYETLRLGERR